MRGLATLRDSRLVVLAGKIAAWLSQPRWTVTATDAVSLEFETKAPVTLRGTVRATKAHTCLARAFKTPEERETFGRLLHMQIEEDHSDSFLRLSLLGVDELPGLLKIERLAAEDAYDQVVIDTASTGHIADDVSGCRCATCVITSFSMNAASRPICYGATAGVRGTRLREHTQCSHWQTQTVVVALRLDGMHAPAVFDGPIDSTRFFAYVEQVVVPTLQPGDVVGSTTSRSTNSLKSGSPSSVRTSGSSRPRCRGADQNLLRAGAEGSLQREPTAVAGL